VLGIEDPPQREKGGSKAKHAADMQRWRGYIVNTLTSWMLEHFHVEFKAFLSTSPRGMWIVSLEGADETWQARGPDFHKAVYTLLHLLEG
jgi:hypothetical protein